MIYVLAGTLAYALFITTLYVLVSNEVEELHKSLKEARRENKWLREELADARDELAGAEDELADARADLEDTEVDLADAIAELEGRVFGNISNHTTPNRKEETP